MKRFRRMVSLDSPHSAENPAGVPSYKSFRISPKGFCFSTTGIAGPAKEVVMRTLVFQTAIRAPRATVWARMLADSSYRQWTAAFCEGSYFEGSWQQGETIRFLSPGGHGMVAVIAESRPYELLAIKHLGVINNGVDDTSSAAVQRWAPAYETYAFAELGEFTELAVTMDCSEEFESYMAKAWPDALDRLKTLCEA